LKERTINYKMSFKIYIPNHILFEKKQKDYQIGETVGRHRKHTNRNYRNFKGKTEMQNILVYKNMERH
jgi:hypothetical protein